MAESRPSSRAAGAAVSETDALRMKAKTMEELDEQRQLAKAKERDLRVCTVLTG